MYLVLISLVSLSRLLAVWIAFRSDFVWKIHWFRNNNKKTEENKRKRRSDRITSYMWLTYIVFRFCPRIFYPFHKMCVCFGRLSLVLKNSAGSHIHNRAQFSIRMQYIWVEFMEHSLVSLNAVLRQRWHRINEIHWNLRAFRHEKQRPNVQALNWFFANPIL